MKLNLFESVVILKMFSLIDEIETYLKINKIQLLDK